MVLDMWRLTRPVIAIIVLSLLAGCSQAAIKIDAAARAREVIARRSLEFQKRSIGGNHPDIEEILELTQDEHLEVKTAVEVQGGMLKQRYEETYKGVKVYDTVVTAGVDKSNHVSQDISGVFVQGIDQDIDDVKPRLSESDATEIAKVHNDDDSNEIIVEPRRAELEIYLDNQEKARLVYIVEYVAIPTVRSSQKKTKGRENPRRPQIVVDANSGEILRKIELLSFMTYDKYSSVGGNVKVGKTYFDGNSGNFEKLSITKQGDRCIFETDIVRVVHMNEQRTHSGEAFNFTCSQGFDDAANGAYSPVSDAMFFGKVIFDMYASYQVQPLKNKPLIMRVHYGKDYENAFWDGQQMTFGNGKDRFYPLVCLDVSSHEVSHGVTEQNSGLIYQGESGGINEAFSDIAGETAKYFMRNTNDWLMGYDIFKADRPLRWMITPSKDNKSIDHAKDFYPSINVHYSSGVFNRAFYLLTTTPGWDINMAFSTMLRANQLYWSASTGFDDGACGAYKAAKDLGYNENDVTAAFKQVGVDGCIDTSNAVSLVETSPFTEDLSSGDTRLFSIIPAYDGVEVIIEFAATYGTGELRSKQGSPPSTYLYYNKETVNLDSQTVRIPFLTRDKLYLSLEVTSDAPQLKIEISFVFPPLLPNAEIGHVLDGVTENIVYKYTLTSDVEGLSFSLRSLHDSPGDLDLYIKINEIPGLGKNDGSSTSPSNNETVTFTNAKAADYFILIAVYVPAPNTPITIMVTKTSSPSSSTMQDKRAFKQKLLGKTSKKGHQKVVHL